MRLRSACLAAVAAGATLLAPLSPALAAGHHAHGAHAHHGRAHGPAKAAASKTGAKAGKAGAATTGGTSTGTDRAAAALAGAQTAATRTLAALDKSLERLESRSAADVALQEWADQVATLLADARTVVAADQDAVAAATTRQEVAAAVADAGTRAGGAEAVVVALQGTGRLGQAAADAATQAADYREQLAAVEAAGTDVATATAYLDDADSQISAAQDAIETTATALLAADTDTARDLAGSLAAAAKSLRPATQGLARAGLDLVRVHVFLAQHPVTTDPGTTDPGTTATQAAS